MRERALAVIGVVGCVVLSLTAVLAAGRMGEGRPSATTPAPEQKPAETREVPLPVPVMKSQVSVEEALRRRRSVREFTPEALTLAQIGQLAWAAQGITEAEHGLRTAPSAGAIYPLTVYFVKADGVYRYRPTGHVLVQLATDDHRARLAQAAGGQPSVLGAPVDVVIAGAPERVKAKYGERADRFVCLEAGHVAQNVLLQAVTLGLAGVPVGAFDDRLTAEAVGLPAGEAPLYIVPVGYPAAVGSEGERSRGVEESKSRGVENGPLSRGR